MRSHWIVTLAAAWLLTSYAPTVRAQTEAKTEVQSRFYGRVNTLGFFSSYSNDSSHILLGEVPNRKLLNFGVKYERRIWIGKLVNWMYDGEILPVALESDPVQKTVYSYYSPSKFTFTQSFVPAGACHAGSGSGSDVGGGVTFDYNYVTSCGRQWTIGEAISPIGLEWNFLPRHKLQPFLVGHGGYMYSTHPIPVSAAGSFNFTFDFGAGLELFRTRSQSVRAEYRYHHISNHETAYENPGIDNGVFQITYSFGK